MTERNIGSPSGNNNETTRDAVRLKEWNLIIDAQLAEFRKTHDPEDIWRNHPLGSAEDFEKCWVDPDPDLISALRYIRGGE